MNLKVTDNLSFPAASLNIFEILSLLVLIPFIDRVVYPGLHRLGFNFSPLRRIGVGLLFAAGSVVLAGIIEIERKHIINTHGTIRQDVFDKSVNASTMSVFYQIPQYILQGTSEALVSVTGTGNTLLLLMLWAFSVSTRTTVKFRKPSRSQIYRFCDLQCAAAGATTTTTTNNNNNNNFKI